MILYLFNPLYRKNKYYILTNGIVREKRRSNMRPLKEKVSITIDENIAAEIRKMAEEDDRSFSQYVNLVLREWVKNKDLQKK